MNKKPTTIINDDEIRKIFNEENKEYGEKFTDKNFQKFIQFLEIDLRDWVKENVREFYRQKQK